MAIPFGVVLILSGVAIFVVGHLAADDELARNHFAGIRTKSTMSSDDDLRCRRHRTK